MSRGQGSTLADCPKAWLIADRLHRRSGGRCVTEELIRSGGCHLIDPELGDETSNRLSCRGWTKRDRHGPADIKRQIHFGHWPLSVTAHQGGHGPLAASSTNGGSDPSSSCGLPTAVEAGGPRPWFSMPERASSRCPHYLQKAASQGVAKSSASTSRTKLGITLKQAQWAEFRRRADSREPGKAQPKELTRKRMRFSPRD